MNEQNLINYYNKFNEDKRFNSRHGQVEYITSLKYIYEYLKKISNPKILDIGAGTGKYSIKLANDGYDVTALELVKHNLRVIEKNSKKVKTCLGNAINLSMFKDNSFDLVLLFGPMYHLISEKDKLKALNEAKRVSKMNGIIMVAYIMNEYAIITHGFRDGNIKSAIKNKQIDDNYHITPQEDDLYSYVRLNDVNKYNRKVGLKRVKILTPDGPANYIRKILNQMDDETFKLFLDYHFKTCEQKEILGASAHILDILIKNKN